MHTPAGYELRDGVVFATDWWAVIFNPSMPYRLIHMLIASGLTVAFLIAGLSALRLLWGERGHGVRTSFRTGVIMGALLIPVQIFVGDMHGLNTLEHQPAKVAAMEGNWEAKGNVPLVLFAIPNEETRSNDYEIGIPNGASLILKHKASGVVPGLNDFVLEDGTVKHPPVKPVFFSFRVMVGIGFAMLFLSWASTFLLWRRNWVAEAMPKLVLLAFVPMALSGWVATLAGWYVTEIGRQPWLVTGVMTTKEAVADVPVGMVLSTLIGYLTVYVLLIGAYISVLIYMSRKAAIGEKLPEPRLPGAHSNPVPAE